MRQRIEDLGRLAVMLETIMKDDIWNVFEHGSLEKAFDEIMRNLTELNEKGFGAIECDSDTELWRLLAGLMTLKDKLWDCLEIAEGEDRLNQPEHGE